MKSIIEEKIFALLRKSDMENDRDRYLFLFLFSSTVFAILIHVVMIPFFAMAGYPLFAGMNICSLVCCILLHVAVFHKHYIVITLVMTAEVSLYAALTTIFFGIDNFFVLYLFLIIVAQMIIPYKGAFFRACVCGLEWLLSIVLYVWDIRVGPVSDMQGYGKFVKGFNMQFCLVGIAALLVAGKSVSRIVRKYNELLAEENKKIVCIDALTGLPNRRGIEMLGKSMEESDENWYVAMLDIDDFKKINDRYGQEVGDEALKTVAKIMTDSVRRTDSVLRWGGEEFLIFLRNVSDRNANKIYNKIRKNIENTAIEFGEIRFHITVTLGVAEVETRKIHGSIRQSGNRLQQGKNAGKNQVVMP